MLKVILILLVFMSVSPLMAQHQELIIKKDTKVYKKKGKKDLLTTLEAGSRVPISTKDYGSWVKIKVELGGSKYYGWIPKSSIRGFRVRKVDPELITGKRKNYHLKKGIGIFTNMSYASVSEQEFNTAGNNKVEITGASGSSVFFGFQYDHAISKEKQLSLYFSMREHEVSGDAKYNSNPIEVDVDLSQSFFALGASLKNYKDADANFWWSYGVEIAKTTDMEVTVANTDSKVPDEEYDFFIFPHLAAGYDYLMLKSLYLIPEAKLNLAANAGGLSYALDLKLTFSYTF